MLHTQNICTNIQIWNMMMMKYTVIYTHIHPESNIVRSAYFGFHRGECKQQQQDSFDDIFGMLTLKTHIEETISINYVW